MQFISSAILPIKRILILLFVVIFSHGAHCGSFADETTECIAFYNETQRSIEIRSYFRERSGPAELTNRWSIMGMGLIDRRCSTEDKGGISLNLLVGGDSVYLKIDDRESSFLLAEGLLNEDNYVYENNTYTYIFTEQDYQNAEPID